MPQIYGILYDDGILGVVNLLNPQAINSVYRRNVWGTSGRDAAFNVNSTRSHERGHRLDFYFIKLVSTLEEFQRE